jgi:adenylylsulfate kinase-like enzyme
MAFAVWITGLPGSGKSTIAEELTKKLPGAIYLRLDAIRKQFIKDPVFTDDERERTYQLFSAEGERLVDEGKSVIYDATAHKRAWRDDARRKIKDFLEVYVKCGIDTCIERETKRAGGLVQADLYKKALERKATGKQFDKLGKVVGVDVQYEENSKAELVIDSSFTSPQKAAEMIVSKLKEKEWI